VYRLVLVETDEFLERQKQKLANRKEKAKHEMKKRTKENLRKQLKKKRRF